MDLVDHPAHFRLLYVGQNELRRRFGAQIHIARIPADADNLNRILRQNALVPVGIMRVGHKPLTDRILAGESGSRHALVDDSYPRRGRRILISERASGNDGNVQRLKEPIADYVVILFLMLVRIVSLAVRQKISG